jgi:hypothetical protein
MSAVEAIRPDGEHQEEAMSGAMGMWPAAEQQEEGR